jgi:heparin/heparan-sulfate lyase
MHRILVVLAIVSSICARGGAAETTGESWIATIRKDHPRLFFNSDTWPRVRQRALHQERDWYDRLKRRVDRYPDNPTSENRSMSPAYRQTGDGEYEQVTLPRPNEWGSEAMQTAFVYLVAGDKEYLEKAKRMLEVSVAAYQDCYEKGMCVNWYSTSRVCALAAYDWLYNDLTPGERRTILLPLLDHIEAVQPGRGKRRIYRLNGSNHTTGFYGVRNLVWFAGLAAYGDGIDDARALGFLQLGHKYNQDLFNYRRQCAGDDGGLATAAVNYAMGAYPWAQFNFLHTWKSATGEDVAADWPHLAYFPNWIMWNWLPGSYPREFGTGDSYHYTNALPVSRLYTHMSQIMHFYGKSHPDCAALAGHIREILPENAKRYSSTWPIHPFLLTDLEETPAPKGPQDSGLHARHFEALGQVFMRSGTGADDTYCLFTIGSRVPSHKQHDENNFVIYKKGYLALDSGTRGRETGFQLRHYYSQTVAHNCILVHMPGERFPGYWGPAYSGKEGQISCGGTYRTTGGRCVAFETNPYYTYVAGDATPCYRPEKCRLALRQMVFLVPDFFIICDRVNSTEPEYRKEWLLHTQNEPTVEGKQFRADEGEGRLFCQTLYPTDAVLAKVGGPGKEFLASGRNWALAPDVEKRWKDRAYFGNWRIEVSPGHAQKDDILLHLIQVGDQALEEMVDSEVIEVDGAVGVLFRSADKRVTVTFSTSGEAGGHIQIADDSGILIDSDLAGEVSPQRGLAGGGL